MPFDHLLKSHYFNFFCRLFEESMERSVLAIIFIIMHYYYTLYSPSTYVSAKSLQYLREPVRLHVHCMTYQSVWLQNNVHVAVNFLSHVIFIFLCFNFISIHYHDQKRKKVKITWDKKLTATYIYKNNFIRFGFCAIWICNNQGLYKCFKLWPSALADNR